MNYLFLLLLLVCSCSGNSQTLRDVDFETSLGVDRLGEEFVVGKKKDKKLYATCQALWSKHRPAKTASSPHEIIQKSIHQLWLSDKPLPRRWKLAQETWIDNHPNWKYRLWTQKDLEALPVEVKAEINHADCVVRKEELLSAYILDTVGGVVVDISSECLSPLDPIHERYHLYANLLPPRIRKVNKCRLGISNTFIGAAAGHPLIKAWRLELSKNPERALERSIEAYGDDPIRINIVFPPTYAFPVQAKFEKKRKSGWKSFLPSFDWREAPLFSTIQPESFAVSLASEKK